MAASHMSPERNQYGDEAQNTCAVSREPTVAEVIEQQLAALDKEMTDLIALKQNLPARYLNSGASSMSWFKGNR